MRARRNKKLTGASQSEARQGLDKAEASTSKSQAFKVGSQRGRVEARQYEAEAGHCGTHHTLSQFTVERSTGMTESAY